MVVRYTSGGPRRQLLLQFCIISEERDREQVCKENKTRRGLTSCSHAWQGWTEKSCAATATKWWSQGHLITAEKKPSMIQINYKIYVQIFTMWNSWLHDQKLLVLNFPHIWNMKLLFTRSQSAKRDRNINTNTRHLCLLRASCEPNYMLGYIIYVSDTDVILHLFIKPRNCLNKFS